jgi:c(7)-type cytochrome triheme protein
MRGILRGTVLIFLGFVFSTFFLAFSAAVHEPVPDMEHGESVTEPAGAPAPAPGKVGGGGVLFRVKDAGDVFFSHDSHVKMAGLKCTDCHDALYITTGKSVPATMKDMEKGKSCGACHDGKKAFGVKANCEKCHSK